MSCKYICLKLLSRQHIVKKLAAAAVTLLHFKINSTACTKVLLSEKHLHETIEELMLYEVTLTCSDENMFAHVSI